MKYKGVIGEFHWAGWLIASAICVIIAYFSFTRFQYVKVEPEHEMKSRIDSLDQDLHSLQMEMKALKEQLASQPKCEPVAKPAKH